MVQALFKVALENQPCAIIIDKVEIKLKREGGTKSAVDQFLISWDELIRSEANVTVIATATDLSELDGALSRRFEEKYRLEPLQTTEERASLYRLVSFTLMCVHGWVLIIGIYSSYEPPPWTLILLTLTCSTLPLSQRN